MEGNVRSQGAARRPAPERRDWGDVFVVATGIGVGMVLVADRMPIEWAVALFVAAVVGVAALTYGSPHRILLSLILLDIPLQFDVHLFYRPEAELVGAVGGVNVSLTSLALLGLAAICVLEALGKARLAERRWGGATTALAAFVLFSTVSAVTARDTGFAVFGLSIVIPAFLVYLYVVTYVREERDAMFVLGMLLVGLVVESSIMISTSVAGQDVSLFQGLGTRTGPSNNESTVIERAGGTLKSPIVAASYIVLLLTPAVAMLVADVPRWLKRLATVSVPLAVFALVLTLSRGAWASGFLSLCIFGVVAISRGWISKRMIVSLAVAGSVVLVGLSNVVVTRLLKDDDGSAFSRIPLNRIALDVMRDHPILGVGINNLGLAMADYRIMDFGGEWMFQVHNRYLLIWAETGPLGLLAFLAFLGTVLWMGVRVTRTRDRLWSPLGLGLTVAVLANALHMLVDSFSARAQIQMLWVNAAVIVAIHGIVFSPRTPASAEA